MAPGQAPIAVITGASSGIGRSASILLAEAGHDVVVHFGRNRQAAEETAARVRHCGRRALVWPFPLEQMDDGDAFGAQLRELLAGWGAERVDALVLNAGIDERVEFEQASVESMRAIFEVNVIAPTLIMQHAGEWLGDGASVVFVSSIAATDPIRDSVAYSSSKAALNALARAMAERLRPRSIRVNTVAPGAVDTPLQSQANRDRLRNAGLLGEPDDVAEVIAFLASDRGRWVDGQVIRVAGPLL